MLPHLKADKVEGLQWNPGLSTPIANMVENKIWSPFSILLQVENPGCGYQPRPASGSHKEELEHPHTLCYSRQDLRFQEVPIRIPPLSVWTTVAFLPDANCSADPLCPQAPPPIQTLLRHICIPVWTHTHMCETHCFYSMHSYYLVLNFVQACTNCLLLLWPAFSRMLGCKLQKGRDLFTGSECEL